MKFIIEIDTPDFPDTEEHPDIVINSRLINKICQDFNYCMTMFDCENLEQIIQDLTTMFKDMKIDTLEKLKYYLAFINSISDDCTFGALLIIIASSIGPIFEKIKIDDVMFKNKYEDHIYRVWKFLEGTDGEGNNNWRRWKNIEKMDFAFMFAFFDIPYDIFKYIQYTINTNKLSKHAFNYALRFNRFNYVKHAFRCNPWNYAKSVIQHDNLDIYNLHKCMAFNPNVPFSYEFIEPQIKESLPSTSLTECIKCNFPETIIGFQLTPHSYNIALFEFSKLSPEDKTKCLNKLFDFKYYWIIEYLLLKTPPGTEHIGFLLNIQHIVNNYCVQIKSKILDNICTDSMDNCDPKESPVIFTCLTKCLYSNPSLTDEQQLLICVHFDLENYFDKLLSYSTIQTVQELLSWILAGVGVVGVEEEVSTKYLDRIINYVKTNFETAKISLDANPDQRNLIGRKFEEFHHLPLNSLKKLLENDIIDHNQIFRIFLCSNTVRSYNCFQIFFSSVMHSCANNVQLLLKTIELNNVHMFKIFKQNPAIIIENFESVQNILKTQRESKKIDRYCLALMR